MLSQKKRLTVLIIGIISIAILFFLIFNNRPLSQKYTEQYELKPDYLGSTLIYASPILAPQLDFLGHGEWQKVTIPNIFIEEHSHYEIWGGNNKPIAGFAGQKTTASEIDLSNIPFSHKSALRIVIFPDQVAPDFASTTFIYSLSPDWRLITFLTILIVLFGIFLLFSIIYQLRLSDIISAIIPTIKPSWARQPINDWIKNSLSTIWVVLFFSSVYGFCLGLFGGGIQIFYVLIKLPVLLLGTTLISFLSWYVLSLASNNTILIRQAFKSALDGLAVQAITLACFTPIILFFIIIRASHDLVLTLHVYLFLAGLLINFRTVFVDTKLLTGKSPLIITGLWIILVIFVGGQLAWLLRPWVGEFDYPGQWIPFMRLYSGNVWTAFFRTIFRL